MNPTLVEKCKNQENTSVGHSPQSHIACSRKWRDKVDLKHTFVHEISSNTWAIVNYHHFVVQQSVAAYVAAASCT